MGASNRHGGLKLSRRLKVLFMGHPGRHEVFRHYFGTKKVRVDAGGSTGPSSSAPPPSPAGDAGK